MQLTPIQTLSNALQIIGLDAKSAQMLAQELINAYLRNLPYCVSVLDTDSQNKGKVITFDNGLTKDNWMLLAAHAINEGNLLPPFEKRGTLQLSNHINLRAKA